MLQPAGSCKLTSDLDRRVKRLTEGHHPLDKREREWNRGVIRDCLPGGVGFASKARVGVRQVAFYASISLQSSLLWELGQAGGGGGGERGLVI